MKRNHVNRRAVPLTNSSRRGFLAASTVGPGRGNAGPAAGPAGRHGRLDGRQQQAESRPGGLRRTRPRRHARHAALRREPRGPLRSGSGADRKGPGRRPAVGRRGNQARQGIRRLPQVARQRRELRRRADRHARPLARPAVQGVHEDRQARLLREAADAQRGRGPRAPRVGPQRQGGDPDGQPGQRQRLVAALHRDHQGRRAGPDPRDLPVGHRRHGQRRQRPGRRSHPGGLQLGPVGRAVGHAPLQERRLSSLPLARVVRLRQRRPGRLLLPRHQPADAGAGPGLSRAAGGQHEGRQADGRQARAGIPFPRARQPRAADALLARQRQAARRGDPAAGRRLQGQAARRAS